MTRVVVLFLVGVSACARPGAPSGGPEDTTRPRVLAVEPESLAVGVSPAAPLVIRFSEKIDGKTLERALWVRPPNVVRDVDVSGETATVRLRKPFPDSTTVQVLVTTAVRDRRRNPLEAPYQWVFSTGDRVAPGAVTGTLERVARAGRGLVLVGLYPASGDTLPDPNTVEAEAITEPLSGGRFRLAGLEPDGRLRLLYAMFDRDGNGEVTGPGEYYSAAPESVVLTPERPVAEVDLRLVDPEAPARVQGKMPRAPGDSAAVLVELYAAEDDSLATAVASARASPAGTFSLASVPPGEYRLIAVCDLDADRRRDDDEPWLDLRRNLVVPAGETLDVGEVPGPRCPSGADDESEEE